VRGLCRHTGSTRGNGRASGYCALYSGLEDRRVSLNTYAREEHSSECPLWIKRVE